MTEMKKTKGISTRGYRRAFKEFLNSYPAYNETKHIDKIRKKDFSRIDKQGHTYLDFTGGGMYADSQVHAHLSQLKANVFGNPHSSNPTSQHATEVTERARKYVLKYFGTSAEDYVCIFTPNASGALKLLGEAYPFEEGDHLLLTFDNHNSVNGIREFARHKKANFNYSPLIRENLRLDEETLRENLDMPVAGKHKLFGFPAQSNVSGVKHDLSWIKYAQERGWHVLLDAAAFVPSNKLDLGEYQPEFVSISFYKIFGYPTGLGCLLVKRSVFEKLQRPWFAGGTITIVSVQGDGFYYDKNNARFEDGTINYLDIPAIETGLRHIEGVGIDSIKSRIETLTDWTLESLSALRHENGKPLVKIYGPQNTNMRGGTISMNFYDVNGDLFNFMEVESMANAHLISLRTGCFCNPGIDETNHALNKDALKAYFAIQGPKDYFDLIEYIGQKRGSVRISLGYVTNFMDVFKFIEFAKGLLNTERTME